MKYFNKSGKPITVDQWRELYRTLRYSLLAENRKDKILVDTSWVGVAANSEHTPALFLTRTINMQLSNKVQTKSHLADIWSKDEQSAMEAHRERCKELGISQSNSRRSVP